ncbi:MAG: hypothetical protein LIO54_00845 [Oscillospiraceae bacterium]|nr:hypothetical protein [Oscillospiraceae bacterium]
MAKLSWDKTGEHYYEAGVDQGVFYPYDASATVPYSGGVAWNGLTKVTEKASGGDATAIYADNIKYLNLRALEEFEATIEGYSFPDEFAKCDGQAIPTAGVYLGQQSRKMFGMCYRTKLGNDTEGDDYGYKLHLLYGLTASPAERAYETIDDSPDATSLSWDVESTPVDTGDDYDYKPVSSITIDSTKVSASKLATLEGYLYGTSSTSPYLPLPEDVIKTLS